MNDDTLDMQGLECMFGRQPISAVTARGRKQPQKSPTQHNPGKIINRNTQGNDSYFTAKDDWI